MFPSIASKYPEENRRHARLVKKASKLAVGELLEIVAMKGITAPGAASSSGSTSRDNASSMSGGPDAATSAASASADVEVAALSRPELAGELGRLPEEDGRDVDAAPTGAEDEM